MKLRLTTDHAASSYGIPVLVDADRNAYGPGDRLPNGETGSVFVRRRRGWGEDLEWFDAGEQLGPEDVQALVTLERKFLSQD